MTPRQLTPTSAAAKAVGVGRSTLWRWIKEGRVRPHARTAGGHLRWDLDRLRDEVAVLRCRDTAPATQDAASSTSKPPPTPEFPAVAVAVTVCHLGVLVGHRHDGEPPVTFVGGKIDPGEDPPDAAVREVKEETGLDVVAGSVPISQRIHPRTGKLMTYIACMPTGSADVHVAAPHELSKVEWVPTLAAVVALMPDLYEPVREHLARLLPGQPAGVPPAVGT